jgi:succinate-acetate transporter protein
VALILLAYVMTNISKPKPLGIWRLTFQTLLLNLRFISTTSV